MKMFILHIFITSLIVAMCKSEELPSQTVPYADRDGTIKYTNLNVFYANIEKIAKYQTLLEAYRKFILQYIGNLDEYCEIYELIDLEKKRNRLKEKSVYGTPQQFKYNSKSDFSNATLRKRRDLTQEFRGADQGDKLIERLLRYYENLKKLIYEDEVIFHYLENSCSLAFSDSEEMIKRGAKVVGKKVKFHSWGGKRDPDIGGKQVDLQTPKIVIRNPFHSWGGKRSYLNTNDVKVNYQDDY